MDDVQHPRTDDHRIRIDLEIEKRKLRHHQGVVENGEELLVARRGPSLVIDQPAFYLEPETALLRSQSPVGKPPLQQRGLCIEAPSELDEFGFIELTVADLLSHGAKSNPPARV